MTETIVKTMLTVLLGALSGAVATYLTAVMKLPGRLKALEAWRAESEGKNLPERVGNMERWRRAIQEDTNTSAQERRILLSSVLACLKGLKEQGCNGPVTTAIEVLETYLSEQAHKPKSFTEERSA